MERDYIWLSDAFYKGYSDGSAVEPLPSHGMSAYPYPEGESYPYDADHLAYLAHYNTRQIVAASSELEHNTIYTNYVKVEVKRPMPIGGEVELVDLSKLSTTDNQLPSDKKNYAWQALWAGLALIVAIGGGIFILRRRGVH